MAQVSWWTRATAFLKKRPESEHPVSPNDNGPATVRLVIDTNIFVAAVRAADSSSRRLLDGVARGQATLLVSPPVFREYRRVLPKAVGSEASEQLIRTWIGRGEPVAAGRGERFIRDDPDDDKFVALALAGRADAIVSNDQHLLGSAAQFDMPVLRPSEALRLLEP